MAKERSNEAEHLHQRLEVEAAHIAVIQRELEVSREVAALYSMLWNIESALAPQRDDREPWEK